MLGFRVRTYPPCLHLAHFVLGLSRGTVAQTWTSDNGNGAYFNPIAPGLNRMAPQACDLIGIDFSRIAPDDRLINGGPDS